MARIQKDLANSNAVKKAEVCIDFGSKKFEMTFEELWAACRFVETMPLRAKKKPREYVKLFEKQLKEVE